MDQIVSNDEVGGRIALDIILNTNNVLPNAKIRLYKKKGILVGQYIGALTGSIWKGKY